MATTEIAVFGIGYIILMATTYLFVYRSGLKFIAGLVILIAAISMPSIQSTVTEVETVLVAPVYLMAIIGLIIMYTSWRGN